MDSEIIHIISSEYGIDAACVTQTREGIIFSSRHNTNKKYILRPCQDSPERKIFTYAVHAHLNRNGFTGTDSILRTQSGRLCIEFAGKIYICSRIVSGRQCSIENDNDLKDASALLAAMHNSSYGFTAERAACLASEVLPPGSDAHRYVRNDLGRMPDLYAHRYSELKRFSRIASRNRGRFDYEYMAIAEKYCSVANDMCCALSESEYDAISSRYAAEGIVCHRDYTSHNIFLISEGAGSVTCFECSAIDMPLLDMTDLIKRRMRKCGWCSSDADCIINSYSRIRTLSKGETDIIKIVLTFPQKLWRIVNKYYNSRRSWCEKSCLMKLAEIKKESAQIASFIKTF